MEEVFLTIYFLSVGKKLEIIWLNIITLIFFRRYHRDDVMGTITAAFKPENAAVWHPIEKRIYSVREIARFQTFPDDFVFYGKNVKAKYQQIGNAVPPHFSKLLAERIKTLLTGTYEGQLEYKLPVSCLLM